MMRDNAVQAKPALAKTIEQRLLSKQGMDLPEALAALVDKIARRSFQMTEHDFAAALAAGFTEDQLFEVVIRTAVGESSWLYRADGCAGGGIRLMRLDILNDGYPFPTRLLFSVIRLFSRSRCPTPRN